MALAPVTTATSSAKPKPKPPAKKKKAASSRVSSTSLRALAYKAGFRGAALNTIVGIVMAESGGNAHAHNGNASTGDNSYGLAQINMIGAMGPQRMKAYGLKSYNDLFDPLTNLRVAYRLSKGGRNFTPWTTFTSGKYRKFTGASPTVTFKGNVGGTAVMNGLGAEATGLDSKKLAEDFGYTAAFYNGDPSLKRLIAQAVAGQWSDQMFQAKLQATAWYRKHTAAERNWYALSTGDPAEAQQRLRAQGAKVQDMFSQMGVGYSKRAYEIARDSLVHGWDDTTLRHAIAAEWRWHYGTAAQGLAGQTIDQFRQNARAYAVPMSDQTIAKWTRQVLAGSSTPDDFTNYLKTQAMSLFPEMKAAIQSGQTVDDYMDPYRQSASQLLEIDPGAVDWLNPKWSQAAFRVDPKTNQRHIMSLADWQTTLRTDPKYGFDKTQGARQSAAQFTDAIAHAFGS